ncbi:serine/threonine protein phosphatase, partial [Campylobacter sp. CH185]
KNGYIIPYALLEKTQDLLKKNPKKYAILDSSDWKKCLYQMPNLSKYKKIHHIGDLQGCYSVLKEYIKTIKE